MDARQLERLASDMEIRNVLARYAHGVDRCDSAVVRSCYHDGAVDHHGIYEGDADAFSTWVVDEVSQYAMTMHVMAQSLIEYQQGSTDVAHVETYALAFHRNSDGPQRLNWITGFRYVDRFERRDVAGNGPEWRIAERTVAGDWISVDPTDNHRRFPDGLVTGRRDGTDISQAAGRAR